MAGKHDQKTHGRLKGRGLNAAVRREGGFTYSVKTGKSPKEGFALSIYPEHEKAISVDALKNLADAKSHIDDYIREKYDILIRPDHYLGGWHDKEAEKLYLDISVVVKDSSVARRLARKYGQEGFYDLKKGETVIVKSAEERRI